MEEPATSGLNVTQAPRESDVEGGRSLAILAPGNGIDPRLVGRARTTSAFGDVQADAGRRAQRLVPQAELRNCRFAHSIEQLSRLLVSMEFLKRKISKVRHRRLLSRAQRGAGDDERTGIPRDLRAEGAGFSFPTCGRQ